MPHPAIPVLAECGGTQLKAPRLVILVDTREQNPFDFSRFEGWFAGIEMRALKLGDYSIAGLEEHCVVERKDLADLVHSFTTERTVFINRLRLMSRCPHRLLVITAALSELKSPQTCIGGRPNRITQFADRRAGRAAGSLPVQRDSRIRGGTGWVLLVSGPSLPLA